MNKACSITSAAVLRGSIRPAVIAIRPRRPLFPLSVLSFYFRGVVRHAHECIIIYMRSCIIMVHEHVHEINASSCTLRSCIIMDITSQDRSAARTRVPGRVVSLSAPPASARRCHRSTGLFPGHAYVRLDNPAETSLRSMLPLVVVGQTKSCGCPIRSVLNGPHAISGVRGGSAMYFPRW